jgi:hypothetical protein
VIYLSIYLSISAYGRSAGTGQMAEPGAPDLVVSLQSSPLY